MDIPGEIQRFRPTCLCPFMARSRTGRLECRRGPDQAEVVFYFVEQTFFMRVVLFAEAYR